MPQILSLDEFLALLNKSQLLTADQFTTVVRQIRAQDTLTAKADTTQQEVTPDSIADELVRQRILTQWQSEQLLRGQSGFVLQQYHLLEPVGRGGMGHVFKARDDRNGAIVAVKVMARRLTNDQTLVNRFRREIRASLRLNNPHIVRTLDAGLAGNIDFMVMEFVNGEQLDRVARRHGVLPVGLSCEIIRQAAAGLQHAFENQMVHRDIKPANLIVHWSADGSGTVKLMDLGLVRLQSEEDQQKTVTRAGQVMGTPDYMSPEQGWDTASVDIRADIYSLGCTLFRLLTGRIPFVGDNPLQVLMARCYKDAPPCRSVRPDIPEAVDSVVRRMTCRDPDSRYQTPQDVIEALAPFCVSLRRESLRRAIADSVESAVEDVEPLSTETEVDRTALNVDTGYQQFLRDVESGVEVELITANSPIAEAESIRKVTETPLPMISQHNSTNPAFRQKPGKQRGTTTAWLVASGAAAVLIAVMFAARPLLTSAPAVVNSNAGHPRQGPTGDVAAELVSADESQSAESPVSPISPLNQAAASVENSTPDAPDTPVSEHQNSLKWNLPDLSPMSVQVGETLETSVASTEPTPVAAAVRYRFGKGSLPGMLLDQQSGRMLWTPTSEQLGSHLIDVELYDEKQEVSLARKSYQIVVEPQMLKFEWPNIAMQKAFAGQVFSLKVPVVVPETFRSSLQMRVGGASPVDVVFDPMTRTVSWAVPETVRGRQLITLVAELIPDHLKFSPDSVAHVTLVVDVQPPRPVLQVPSAELIAEAEQELRNLFRRDVSLARTPVARSTLAARFLDRAFEQSADPADFALLNLAGELAEKARAPDLLLEIEHLKRQRYGTDELHAGLNIVAGIKRPSLSALQSDLVLEHLLRLAADAAELHRWVDVATLLETVEQVAKSQQSVSARLQQDASRARAIADDLVRGSRESLDLAGVGEIKIRELTRLIQQWQFAPLFDDPESAIYLQSSNTVPPLPNAGRSLWVFADNSLTFETATQAGLAGFVDTSRESGSCVIRLQLKAQTNSVNLIFGAGRETELRAFLLTLDSSAPGRIQKLPGGVQVAESPRATTTTAAAGSPADELSTHAEIIIDGTTVTTKFNGITVAQSIIRDLMPGRMGLMVPLQRPDGGPKLDIVRARILQLPDDSR